MLICAVFSSYMWQKKGFYDVSQFDPVVWNGHRYDITPVQGEWTDNMKLRMHGIKVMSRPEKDDSALENGGIARNLDSLEPPVLVMGDSHCLMWSPVINEIATEREIPFLFLGMDARYPFVRNFSLENSADKTLDSIYDSTRVKAITARKSLIVLAVRWSWNWRYYEAARKMIEFVDRQGGRTLLIEQPPELFFGDKNAPQYLSFLGVKPNGEKDAYVQSGNLENYEKGQDAVRRLAQEFDSCELIRTADLFSNKKGETKVLRGRKVLFIDDDHLSLEGARLAKERIKHAISENIILVKDANKRGHLRGN